MNKIGKPKKKIHKCYICDKRFNTIEGVYAHLEKLHTDSIPQDWSTDRYYYYLRTGKIEGKCVVCGSPTEWNPSTTKYHRFCNNPKCKEKYVESFKSRMIGKYGKPTLLNDPTHQKKMLANRSISGEYKWSDGVKMTYTGSYEKDFLKFLDIFMNFDSSDIMAPSPHTYYYNYDGEDRFYIPDFWIPSLNLEIEIKESDNNHPHMKVDREKERLKDDVMESQNNVNYIKLVDKQYGPFIQYLLNAKEEEK